MQYVNDEETPERKIGLSEAVPAFQNQVLAKLALAIDSCKQPAKDEVSLNVRRVNAKLDGLLVDLAAIDHENHLLIFCQILSRALPPAAGAALGVASFAVGV